MCMRHPTRAHEGMLDGDQSLEPTAFALFDTKSFDHLVKAGSKQHIQVPRSLGISEGIFGKLSTAIRRSTAAGLGSLSQPS